MTQTIFENQNVLRFDPFEPWTIWQLSKRS